MKHIFNISINLVLINFWSLKNEIYISKISVNLNLVGFRQERINPHPIGRKSAFERLHNKLRVFFSIEKLLEFAEMRSSSSSKQAADNSRGINGHILTLHQRLYHALNLGTR